MSFEAWHLIDLWGELEHVTSIAHYAKLVGIGRTRVLGVQANGEVLSVLGSDTYSSAISGNQRPWR